MTVEGIAYHALTRPEAVAVIHDGRRVISLQPAVPVGEGAVEQLHALPIPLAAVQPQALGRDLQRAV